MSEELIRYLPDEQSTVILGAQLSSLHGLILLHGELGAGKTTLVRGFLRALGHRGVVQSPTYTLVEPYECSGRRIFHLDIYRLNDPDELSYLGVREQQSADSTLLVEWPGRARNALGAPDAEIFMEYDGAARKAIIRGLSELAASIVKALSSQK